LITHTQQIQNVTGTLKFRRDNKPHGEKKHCNNEKTKQVEAFCQILAQNLLGLQGSLVLGAAHEEDQTHKPVKCADLKNYATCRIMFVMSYTFSHYETNDSYVYVLKV